MIMMFYIAVLAMTTTSTCSFLHKTLSINHRFQLSKTILSATINDQSIDQGIKIKSCNNMDISRAANFLGQYWFDEDTEMSRSQRQEFIRLENTDLTRRYGEIVGRRNSTLLMATESEEIVG